jgi:lysophospholipase L1-like esterase
MNKATRPDSSEAPDGGRSRRVVFALAAVAISVVVTLLGLEVALRVYWAAKNRWTLHNLPPLQQRVVIPSADPELIYELNPGASHGDVSINSWGMRDDPTTLEKPPGCFRIAFVGDSISCGMGLCEKRILYHDVLERELNADAPPGRRFECLNFSANGYSIGQELRLFQRRVRAFDPDVVVLQSCLNDPYPTESEYVHQQPLGPSRLLTTLWSRLAPASFYAWSAVETNYDEKGRAALLRGLQAFAKEARKGPPILVVLFPYTYRPAYEKRGFDRFHRLWSEDAAQAGIPFLDLKGVFDAAGEIDARWPKDPLHPSVEGGRLAAHAIRRELETRGLLPITKPEVER